MSTFRSPLRFEDDGGLPFTLIWPLVYDSDALGYPVTVPSGFRTDLASIPRPLWNILPPIGRYDRAAVVHDLLYQRRTAGVDRGLADVVLREAMEVCGVGAWTRRAIYWGVRLGGWRTWNRYRAADQVPT
jgi:hypothetical protein